MFKKIILVLIIILILIYITSCLQQTNIFNSPSSSSIIECFDAKLKSGQHSVQDIKTKIYGEWLIDDQISILFNIDNRCFIFDNDIIIDLGTFEVNYINGKYIISTTNINDSAKIQGNVYICNKDIYNETNGLFYKRLCDCYIN